MAEELGKAKDLAKSELPRVHRLESRLERALHLARIASGDAMVKRTAWNSKDNWVEEWDESPSFRDQVSAAKLLGLMYADFTVKQETKETKQTTVFVQVDNGRGPALGEVKALPASPDYDICPHCTEPVDAALFESHLAACPEKKMIGPGTNSEPGALSPG